MRPLFLRFLSWPAPSTTSHSLRRRRHRKRRGSPSRLLLRRPIASSQPQRCSSSRIRRGAPDPVQRGCIVAATADGRAIASQAMQTGEPIVLKARGEVVLRVGDSSSCAPAVKPDSPEGRRPSRVGAGPQSSSAVVPASDEQPAVAAAAGEPVPTASDAALPQPDPPAAPASDQF